VYSDIDFNRNRFKFHAAGKATQILWKKKNPAEKEQLQETQCCDGSSYTEI